MLHRLKFHLKPLVDEMLDQLPPEVFTSDKTTFLDPAMAGGQFLREIKARLRSAGHSDDNIRSRIWGCEILNGRLNYCRRFGGVISDHLIQTDFLSYDWGNMKFDVIVGNPPYQDTMVNGERKSLSSNLWSKFIDKSANQLLAPNGYLAMVVPASWAGPTKNLSNNRRILKDIMAAKNTTHISLSPELNNYFGGVGSTFSWFVLQNASYAGNTTITLDSKQKVVVDLRTVDSLPRINHPLAYGINQKYFSKVQGDVISGQYRTSHDQYQEKKTKSYRYPAYHTPADGGRIWYMKEKHPNYHKHKVIISLSGKYQPYADPGKIGYTDMCLVYILKDHESLSSAQSVFDSALYHFIMDSNKWSGFNNKQVIRTFVIPPLNKDYTDQELCAWFGLTDEETSFIMNHKDRK